MSDHLPARCCRHVFTPACPIDCLQAVLSMATFNTPTRTEGAPFDPPPNIGQVIALLQHKRLSHAAGLGPRRLGEIQAGLVLAGPDIGDSDEKKEPPLRAASATGPAPAGVAVPATPALPRRLRDVLPAAGPGSNRQPAAGPDMLRRVLDGLKRL